MIIKKISYILAQWIFHNESIVRFKSSENFKKFNFLLHQQLIDRTEVL